MNNLKAKEQILKVISDIEKGAEAEAVATEIMEIRKIALAEEDPLLVKTFRIIADKIKEITLRIGAKAGTSGKIFGSVTNTSIAQALKEQCEVEVIRSKVDIVDDVKELGTYKANVRLHPEVLAEVSFEVVAE